MSLQALINIPPAPKVITIVPQCMSQKSLISPSMLRMSLFDFSRCIAADEMDETNALRKDC